MRAKESGQLGQSDSTGIAHLSRRIHERPRLFSVGDEAMLRGCGAVRPDLDRIIVQPPYGLLCWRPGGIVHELHCGHGLTRRRIADGLVDFAIDDATARPFALHEAIFVTDSDDFARYIEARYRGSIVHEAGKQVYSLRLRP